MRQDRAVIISVSDHQKPALVRTSKGLMQIQRRLADGEYNSLIHHLQQHEHLDIPCCLSYIFQTEASGCKHTLVTASCGYF